MFFQGRDPVHASLRRLVKHLDKAQIPYAIMGGMAVKAHKHVRMTDDLDVLLTPEGFAELRKRLVPKKYQGLPGRPRRLVDQTNGVTVDCLLTGHFPGSGQLGPISFPDPTQVSETIDNVKVIDLPTLIQLKLAARRYQDLADVVSLIRANQLDESFQGKLHPAVHRDYIECLEEMRREEEYESRQDQQFLDRQQDQGDRDSGE